MRVGKHLVVSRREKAFQEEAFEKRGFRKGVSIKAFQ